MLNKLMKALTVTPQSLFEILERVFKRGVIWNPGLSATVGVKDADQLWVLEGSGFSEPVVHQLDISKFCRMLIALKKRHDPEMSYRDALLQSLTKGAEYNPLVGIHAQLPSRYTLHFYSLVGVLMNHEIKTQKKSFLKWLKKAWKNPFGHKIAFIDFEEHTHALAAGLVKEGRTAFLCLGNRGVFLQCDISIDQETLSLWARLEDMFCSYKGYGLMSSLSQGASVLVPSSPPKVYFQEAQYFNSRFKAVMQKGGIHPSAWRLDWSATQLLKASQILYSSCPQLSEVSKKPK